ncbi:hypothetical protein [Alkaliphilus sp. B6464]|uniref:hypothetical protein n=1 Tax=Alkaliphilus sp. B6464 TaxID=2731219 RepID=UPI001BACB498|nr:hypothetical protein [Alkaliphilus sp. B6464]QUH21831.1 hypothetical protein HYG84_18005 [Alkaliphilus sp. B6464]
MGDNLLKTKVFGVLKDNKKNVKISSLGIIYSDNEEIIFSVGDSNIVAFIDCSSKLNSSVRIEIDCSDGYGGLIDEKTIYDKISDVIFIHDRL